MPFFLEPYKEVFFAIPLESVRFVPVPFDSFLLCRITENHHTE